MDPILLPTEGVIFDIQRYSIHDGPGIRTTVFLKGCPLTCPWCANPESQKTCAELEYIEIRCARCHSCIKMCPAGAVREEDGKIAVDRVRCTMCGTCWEACPAGALQAIGRTMTVEEVLTVVKKDAPYYKRSGGGVTLSGGEPLMQANFSAALLKACQEAGLNTAMETSGYLSWDTFEPVARYVDVMLYDIKHMDSQKHRLTTGIPNETILKNVEKIIALGKTIIIRIPVIPGYNDDSANILAIAGFAAGNGVREINLLPYHNMAEPKYRRLGREYGLADMKRPTDEHMNTLKMLIDGCGVQAKIGG